MRLLGKQFLEVFHITQQKYKKKTTYRTKKKIFPTNVQRQALYGPGWIAVTDLQRDSQLDTDEEYGVYRVKIMEV